MIKCHLESVASYFAKERGLFYGWSIFAPGAWYVGTREQLKSVGVADVKEPLPH